MTTEQLKPMDIYADHRTPFDIAAYCRGHKYSTYAVEMTRALRAEDEAAALLRKAEAVAETARDRRIAAVQAVRERMEGAQNV